MKIRGRVASKKNAKRLIRSRGRIIPISSKAWMAFEKSALEQLGYLGEAIKLKPPYKIDYEFYMRGKGATDLDNMIAGINDILEKGGLIGNDKHVHEIQATKYLDSKEYETVVRIYEL